jgi:hypothetical protein
MYESDEKWIADYLRLKNGEEINSPKSVKASEIKLIGAFTINGIVTDYFSYPYTGEPSWVIIEVTGDKEDCERITS